MSTTFGLTSTGFAVMTFNDVRAALNAALIAAFGTALDLSDLSILGIIVAILSEQYALLWATAEQIYNSQNPDAATGTALDVLSLITGTFRPAATSSVAFLTFSGTVGTVITAGSQVADVSTGSRFATAATVTLVTATPWAAATFVAGAVVSNATKIYICITGGNSVTGPTTTSLDATDGGTAHWRYVGTGLGAITNVESFCTNTGKIYSASGNLSQIQTPIGGWSGTTNLLDAAPGRAVATDAELRLFREEELAAEGSSPADAIRAALLALADVVSVTVFHNDTDIVDANGLPPHTVECLVRGTAEDAAADTAIANVLLANVAAGIGTFSAIGAGHKVISVADAEGVVQTMMFTRPIKKAIAVDMTLTYDATLYPTDGDVQIKAAIVAWGDALACGRDAVASAIAGRAWSIPGVLDVSATLIALYPATPTVSTTIPVSVRELSTYDTLHITIHSSAATP